MWYTRNQIAMMLDVSERTVTRRVDRGEILREQVDGRNMYQPHKMEREDQDSNKIQDLYEQLRDEPGSDESGEAQGSQHITGLIEAINPAILARVLRTL
jgi:hypothetical protein